MPQSIRPSRLAKSMPALLSAVQEYARYAGALLREEFDAGPRGRGTHAEVDVEVERWLQRQLLLALPCGYLGEELGAVRSRARCTWVVDPNDGTESYLRGLRGPAVSVALLRDGLPVLGVVYSYRAPTDAGTMFAWAEGCGPLTVDGVVAPRAAHAGELVAGASVAVSQDAALTPRANAVLCQPCDYRATPSVAYRLALAAAGDCVAACSLAFVRSWDVAAGHALLRGAGRVLVDAYGQPVTYDRAGEMRQPTRGCFGGAEAVVQTLAARDWPTCLRPERAYGSAVAARRPSRKRKQRKVYTF